jgi:hypothetical protein
MDRPTKERAGCADLTRPYDQMEHGHTKPRPEDQTGALTVSREEITVNLTGHSTLCPYDSLRFYRFERALAVADHAEQDRALLALEVL